MRKLRPIAFSTGAALLVVMFLFRPQPSKERLPSSIPPLPMTLLCAGRADLDRTFTFASANGDLAVRYDSAGVARVSGPARVSWRGIGDSAEFDGILPVEGTRSADGRVYELHADANGVRLAMRLEQGDSGSLTVSDPHQGGGESRQFHSRCQDDPSGF